MSYQNLRECLADLERTGQLVRIEEPVDPYLEMAEIQRRVFRAAGPVLYFENVKGTPFPMVSNLFGTMERMRFLFRDSIEGLRTIVELGMDPGDIVRRPRLYLKTPWTAWHARPRVVRSGPVLAHQTTIDQLPGLVSWPDDGGAYITLPIVMTEDPDRPGLDHANLGMYRVQLSGGKYERNKQVGIHYQLHRGIAAHHAAAIRRGHKLMVNVFVGGPPALSVAAVMPLPEGMSELAFAGMLGNRRVAVVPQQDYVLPIIAEADFCITGFIEPNRLLPEGPFGDHLGYYSLSHDFPVIRVLHVYHRKDAIWPFTVVGRPPQEDTMFGRFIHELVGPVIPKTVPGVKAVHAVDAAGVHPLLLAVGSERYVPYDKEKMPRELLTQASALLGQGQLSLAKYLWIAAAEDDPGLEVDDVAEFLRHMLERVDWRRDLHFHTCTTIDTLDYSGDGLNQGSKVVIAAAGPSRRRLPVALSSEMGWPAELDMKNPKVCLPGIVAVEGPKYASARDGAVERFAAALPPTHPINAFPLIVVVDDSRFSARSLENLLWTVFTKSNPASDVYGIGAFTENKHWGCLGSLVIDARSKPHHAPPLVEDPEVSKRVDSLAAVGGPLEGLF